MNVDDIRRLKKAEIIELLLKYGKNTQGNKADLVLRCYAAVQESNSNTSNVETSQSSIESQDAKLEEHDPEFTYRSILNAIKNPIWTKDLRKAPHVTFIQLYEYLVVKTAKYDHLALKSTGYKKLKSFNFFVEGHIKSIEITSDDKHSYVKALVLASMISKRYAVIIVFDKNNGDVIRAACQCPAGRGLEGLGHCNHVGAVIFALEDFGRKGLREHNEPVSCTSKLCGWKKPRNLKIAPSTINELEFKKYHFGKAEISKSNVNTYDPRAYSDRSVSQDGLNELSTSLIKCLPSSNYYLFYDIKPECPTEIDTFCAEIPDTLSSDLLCDDDSQIFNDIYDISTPQFRAMVDIYADNETITIEEIIEIEQQTRGQSSNPHWKLLRESKLTASNFGLAAKRRKEPDKLLKQIMYSKNITAKSLLYGINNEPNAVKDYIKYMHDKGNTNLTVIEVGTILSTKKPGLGASLDRKVYDPLMAQGQKEGGLEVKCPISKANMSVQEACEDSQFYLSKDGLKTNHNYYYQIQGQMFVCELSWVDFVVWFGPGNLSVTRILFDNDWWHDKALPRIDYFYRKAFLPEIFTKRVKRGLPLYGNKGWKPYHFKH